MNNRGIEVIKLIIEDKTATENNFGCIRKVGGPINPENLFLKS